MPRKKAKDRSKLYSRLVGVRVTEKVYRRLEDLRDHGNCSTVGEVARQLLSRKKIVCYYHDSSLEDLMFELCLVQRELNAIGVNINQITRYFNSTTDPRKKLLYALKANDQNRRLEKKVDEIMEILNILSYRLLPNDPEPRPIKIGRFPLDPDEIRDT